MSVKTPEKKPVIPYAQILRKTAAYRRIANDAAADRPSHCYILVSKDGAALASFSRLATVALLCGTACGECLTCRKIISGTHGDVLYFPQEHKKIDAEEASAIISKLNYRPLEAPRRVFVLRGCEELNSTAQNKLLKTLEEPPKDIVFLMEARTTAGLLQTVLSRARVVNLDKLSTDDVAACVRESAASLPQKQQPSEEEVLFAAEYSDGSVERALSVLGDAAFKTRYNLAWDVLLRCASSRDTLLWGDKIADKEGIKDFLIFLAEAARDVAVYVTLGEQAVRDKARLENIREIALHYDDRAASSIMDRAAEALRKTDAYCNVNAVADSLLLGIMEDRAKCQKS